MLDAIAALGEYLIENSYKDRTTEIFVDSGKLKGIKYVLSIVLEKKNGDLKYSRVVLEEFDPENIRKYLYKTHASNRFDISPTTKRNFAPDRNSTKNEEDQTREKAKKTIERIIGWFKHDRFSKYKNSYPLLSEIEQTLMDNKKQIIKEITTEAINLDRKDRKHVLVTLKFLEDKIEKYLGDMSEFVDIFLKEAPEDLYNKFKGISKGQGTCYVCGKNDTELWGFASPFNFFSVDKPGFAPNFSQFNSWKMLPICGECAIKLQAGRRFLEEYGHDILYGYNYYVIPRIHDDNQRKEIIQDIIKHKKHIMRLQRRKRRIYLTL